MTRINYISAMRLALKKALAEDPKVFLMGEDIGPYGGVFKITSGLHAEFGAERVRDTPISEGAFVGAALGASMLGYRPVVEIMYVDFTLVAMDQIINEIAKARFMTGGQYVTPVTLLTQGGGGKGNAAQHSQSLEGFFAATPGLNVAMPATVLDAYDLLLAAIRDDDPSMVIAHKLLFAETAEVELNGKGAKLGRATIRRPGRDVSIVVWSAMVARALSAAEALAEGGIDAEVIDLRWIRPVDQETVFDSVRKTSRCLVVQEAPLTGGFGAEIAALVGQLCFDHLDAPVSRLGGAETPMPYAAPLEALVIPNADSIAKAVRRLI
jgi:pyruvate/2-oxoglutarate/acetoin dehydrogenase E1 component